MGFLPLPVAIMVAALFTSRPTTRIGRRIGLLLGPALAFVGMAWLTQITAPSAYLEVLRGGGPILPSVSPGHGAYGTRTVVADYSDYMPKSQPVTVRLSPELDRWVSAEAKRTQRPKGTVVESLAQEALKARMLPGIAFRGDDWDRRAWVLGTSFDVWEVVRSFQDTGSIDAVASGGRPDRGTSTPCARLLPAVWRGGRPADRT